MARFIMMSLELGTSNSRFVIGKTRLLSHPVLTWHVFA